MIDESQFSASLINISIIFRRETDVLAGCLIIIEGIEILMSFFLVAIQLYEREREVFGNA